MTIQVQNDGRILVDFIQHGCRYSTVALANHEAQKLKDNHYPKANVILAEIQTIPEPPAFPAIIA